MNKFILLNYDSPAIVYLSNKDKHLAKVIQTVGPLNYQIQTDSYAFLISQIAEQMLSKKVATILTRRIVNLCHGQITIENIANLNDQEILGTGLSHSKVSYIRNLTNAIVTGKIDFSSYYKMDDEAIIRNLTTVKGIGNWSAKMYLIFSMDRPDVLPFEDLAFLEGYNWVYKPADNSAKTIQKKCQKWHPYASIAARYLYKSLDLGLTKNTFHLFK